MKRNDYIFENLKIVQDDSHHKYGTDALLLSAFAKGGSKSVCVDFGCGNGVIPLCLAYTGKAKKAVGIEIQESSAALADESVEINGFGDKIEIVRGDFTKPLPIAAGSFDYAVSNPPYMKADSGKPCGGDERNIARHEIGCDIYSVCAAAKKYVRFGGDFFVVYRPDRISDLFAALRVSGFEPKRMTFVCARKGTAPSLVLISAKSGAAAGCTVTPVFFIYNEDGSTSDAMKSVYGGGSI